MIVGLNRSPDTDEELQAAQLAHALVGAAETHATRAEQAYRDAGAEPADLIQSSLMAFGGVNCQNEVDELALICGGPPASPESSAPSTSPAPSHAKATSARATHSSAPCAS
ncbi:MAG: hypothetical protein ACRDZ8_09840 [Acidimicrobiales bacterium]